jgi:hypothetical protein
MVAYPRSSVLAGNNEARYAPAIASNEENNTQGIAVDDGFLTRFSSWTTVSSTPWTTAPHELSKSATGKPPQGRTPLHR